MQPGQLEHTMRTLGRQSRAEAVELGQTSTKVKDRALRVAANGLRQFKSLCVKSGNAAILRGGSECFASSQALFTVLTKAFEEAELPKGAVQMVPTSDRAAVGLLLSGLAGAVDVIIPRGGRELIERVSSCCCWVYKN